MVLKKICQFSVIFLLMLPFITSGQKKTGITHNCELIINGSLSNFEHPVNYIYVIYADQNDGFDSVKIVNGKYTLERIINTTVLLTLYSKSPTNVNNLKDRYMFTIITEPTTINITSDLTMSNSTVSGTKANDEYIAVKKRSRHFYNELTPLYKHLSIKESQGSDSILFLQRQIDSIKYELVNSYRQYIDQTPSSYIKLILMDEYFSDLPKKNIDLSDINGLKFIFDDLPPNEKKSLLGRRIQRKLTSYLFGTEKNAPEFLLEDNYGKGISLKSFRGKYILLDFWASWCSPCRIENRNLVKIHSEYKDKNFTIVSISLDKLNQKDEWINAIKKDNLTWTQVSDFKGWDSYIVKLYRISEIPQNFLIDPFGRIIGKNLFGEDLKRKLSEIF